MNFKTLIILIATAIVNITCSNKSYVHANRSYKKQAKAYGKILGQHPLNDSVANAPYWIGTTNFNMRKPNFVILHHTAQDSCGQTLKTFTMKRTEVSAHYVIC